MQSFRRRLLAHQSLHHNEGQAKQAKQELWGKRGRAGRRTGQTSSSPNTRSRQVVFVASTVTYNVTLAKDTPDDDVLEQRLFSTTTFSQPAFWQCRMF